MAAEYEIKEIGFIGSLWQGEYNAPLNVGKTFEITNVLNTIESGRRQSVFFTTKENVDPIKLTSQLPDLEFRYESGRLPPEVTNDLSTYTKIDLNFLQTSPVLFRYSSRAPVKGILSSTLPIQENWSFDVSNLSNVKYIYNRRDSITFVPYVFLFEEQYLNQLISYFSGLQQETFIIASPPPMQPVIVTVDPLVSTVMPPPPPFFSGATFEQPDSNDFFIEEIAVQRFTNDLELFLSEATENRDNSLFLADTNVDINRNLKTIDERIAFINDMMMNIGSTSNLPFTQTRGMRIEILYLGMIRNYLLDKLRQINDVGFFIDEPERYSQDQEGNIVIEPKAVSDPPPVIVEQRELDRDFDEFDDFIDEIIEDLEVDDNNVYIFKKVSKITDYDLPTLRYKTKGLFRCTGEKLSTFYTGSLTEKQQKYYTTIFNELPGTTDSYHQFDISYCHISGSGSSYIEGEIDFLPAKSMYKKYMLECFGHTNGKFPFKNGKNGDYFYTIQLDRNQYKEKLDAGNFELALCELSASGNTTNPTSTRFFTLIDESKDTKQEVVTSEGIQEYYYITSGSLRDGIYNEPTDDAWGIVFPKMGLIVLDGVVLDQSCSFATVTGSVDGQNSKRLFLAISGAAVPNSYRPSGSFFARSFETFLTETYFCRADFYEFNTSTNYTYTTGSDGFLKFDYFKSKPNSYITTIGLYNRKKELLAVGKLRNPILKNESKVCTFEVVVRLN